MKNAIIVTVHNSENCGSFLQAYALQTVLQRLEYDVRFLYRDEAGTSHDRKKCIHAIWYNIKHLHIFQALEINKQWYLYEKLQQSFFNIVAADSNFAENTDIVVLGSDTIWNFDDLYFRNTASRLLGCLLKKKSVISYAASVGNTEAIQFKSVALQCGGINHIKTLLVRDKHTQKVLKESFNRESELVCDPTLLLQPHDFESLYSNVDIKEPFLLLYYFGEVSSMIQQTIVNYAKKKSLKIVSLLVKRNWCDLYVPSSPQNMVTYYSRAAAVLTNTFHGCALSLIFQVPFAAHDEGKVKVKELLEAYSVNDRYFVDETSIPEILSTPINNRDLVQAKANESKNLLIKAINENNNDC